MEKKEYSQYGYRKIATVAPKLFLGQVNKNADKIIELSKKLAAQQNWVILFPELALTGYTCEDFFHSSELMRKIVPAIEKIAQATKDLDSLIVFGSPYQTIDGRIYNTAIAMCKGKILGISPKTHLPNYKEFYEMRWFSSGKNVEQVETINNQEVYFGANFLLKLNQDLVGIEICESLWAPLPDSTYLALAGAAVILNPSASNELIGKNNYRRDLISNQSARLNCVYAYASSGALESSKDVVFGGACLIAENGQILGEGKRFSFEDEYLESTVDLNKIMQERVRNTTFGGQHENKSVKIISAEVKYSLNTLDREYEKNPFIPQDESVEKRAERFEEVLEIQSTGLARQMLSARTEKLFLGLSGGSDSTLVALISVRALKKLGLPSTNLITVSMPGFGTSERTKGQARDLAEYLGTTFMEIDITKASKQHLEDINHTDIDVTYENTQARERNKTLLDLANKHNGIVILTSNLSESACGFSSYGADSHSGHYNPLSGSPKTLGKALISYEGSIGNEKLRAILERVLKTPISPELLPTSASGEIQQSSEEILGPYEVIDFLLYHFVRNSFSKEKINVLMHKTFANTYSVELLEKTHKGFFKRFFSQQFKRTMMPAGVKSGSVSLSPRGDWRFPNEYTEED